MNVKVAVLGSPSLIVILNSPCSACACGMNEWSGEWMSEWSADGMNVIVLHELRATQVQD